MPHAAGSICGDWVEVREESADGKVVLRSIDAELPPARGRRRLVLLPDGQLKGGSPGPDDRLRAAKGDRWSVEGDRLHIASGEWAGTYEIEMAGSDKLVLHAASTAKTAV